MPLRTVLCATGTVGRAVERTSRAFHARVCTRVHRMHRLTRTLSTVLCACASDPARLPHFQAPVRTAVPLSPSARATACPVPSASCERQMSVETAAPAAAAIVEHQPAAAAGAASSDGPVAPVAASAAGLPLALAKSPSKLPPLAAAGPAAAAPLSLLPLPLPAIATSVVHTALRAGVSPAFFRLVARLQLKFHRLKSRTAAKLTEKLRQQKQRDEQLLASKLVAGRPIRGHKASLTPAFLGLPGSEMPPNVPALPLSQSPPPQSESPTAAGSPGVHRMGSRPTTPASQRGGDSIQRSPRLPNKAADLLFGSQKHVDKRADILGLSNGQIQMIDANPASQKALAMMGVVAATGPQALVQMPVLDPPLVESPSASVAVASAPITRHTHGRTHSDSSRALLAGLVAAEVEEQRLAELERIRAERDAGKAEKLAAAAAARPPETMTGKAQQILVGGTTGKAAVVVAPLPLTRVTSRPVSPAPIATNRSDQSARGNAGTKVLDKLGVTAKQLEHFPNHQSRAFNKLGVDVHLASSMLTDENERHVAHAKDDAIATRAGEEAKEAARLEQDAADHAAKHQSSKKVTQLLHGGGGGRDKRLDKLGMTAKEMATFQSQPKAFQKLGVFDQPLTARSAAAAAAQGQQSLPNIAKGQNGHVAPRNLQVPGSAAGGSKPPVPRNSAQPSAAAAAQSAAAASSAATPAAASEGGAVRMMQNSASAASTLAHRRTDSGAPSAYARSESPANGAGPNRRVLPSLAKGGKAITPASRWNKLKAQPAGSSTSSIAALSRTGALQPGMSYSSSLASLKGSPAAAGVSAGSNASLARAYGASAVAATSGGARGGVAPRENLFSVVMAAKKIRAAAGGMKTVIGGPGHVGAATQQPLASIQSGKGVPSSLGQFALQGVSATISPLPQPGEDDASSPAMKRRALHSRGGVRGSTGGSMSGAAITAGAATSAAAGTSPPSRARLAPSTSSSQLEPYEGSGAEMSTSVASRSKAQVAVQSGTSASTSPDVAVAARRSLKSKADSNSSTTPSAVSRSVAGARIPNEEDDAAYLANVDR